MSSDSGKHLPLAEVRILPEHGVKASLTPAGRDSVVAFLHGVIEKLNKKACTGPSWENPDSVYRLKLTRK